MTPRFLGACALVAMGCAVTRPQPTVDKHMAGLQQRPAPLSEIEALATWQLKALEAFDGEDASAMRFSFRELPEPTQEAFREARSALSAAFFRARYQQRDPLIPLGYRLVEGKAVVTDAPFEDVPLATQWAREPSLRVKLQGTTSTGGDAAAKRAYRSLVDIPAMRRVLRQAKAALADSAQPEERDTLGWVRLMTTLLYAINGCRERLTLSAIEDFLNGRATTFYPIDAWLPVLHDGRFASRWLGLRGLLLRPVGVSTRWTFEDSQFWSPLDFFWHDLVGHHQKLIEADARWALRHFDAGGLLSEELDSAGSLHGKADVISEGAGLRMALPLWKYTEALAHDVSPPWRSGTDIAARLRARHGLWRAVLRDRSLWGAAIPQDHFGAFQLLHESAASLILLGQVGDHLLPSHVPEADPERLAAGVHYPEQFVLVHQQGGQAPKRENLRLWRKGPGISPAGAKEKALALDVPLPE